MLMKERFHPEQGGNTKWPNGMGHNQRWNQMRTGKDTLWPA